MEPGLPDQTNEFKAAAVRDRERRGTAGACGLQFDGHRLRARPPDPGRKAPPSGSGTRIFCRVVPFGVAPACVILLGGQVIAPSKRDIELCRRLVDQDAQPHRRGQKNALAATPFGGARIVAAFRRFGRLVELLFGVLGPLSVRCGRRCQESRQIPAGRRQWQALLPEALVSRPGTDQVEA